MFSNFKRINSNEFEVVYSNKKYKNLTIRCSSIWNRMANVPYFICDNQVKNDIRTGIIKICQVLDGMYEIKILEYKKYSNIINEIRMELGSKWILKNIYSIKE